LVNEVSDWFPASSFGADGGRKLAKFTRRG